MDALRIVQLLTDLAYLLLGVAAVAAAMRSRERARADVALLFGSLAGVVILQEIGLLTCSTSGCLQPPGAATLTLLLILVLPYSLLRLLDDVADLPTWQMWLALMLVLSLGIGSLLVGSPTPVWLTTLILIYLVVGAVYAAAAFVLRARRAMGITRRRMAAVAWACGFLAATLVLGLLAPLASPILAISRVAGLISGLCVWAGFFPPHWLSQAWRLPELLEYLRPTRLMAAASDDQDGVATDALALDRLSAATARTTGARRTLLLIDDPTREDLYLWGAPSARISRSQGVIGEVMESSEPAVVESLARDHLPPAVMSVFGTNETLPRTALLVPICLHGRAVGVLGAFADKGPMFVEDDLEIVKFFAGEAAAILQMRALRASANELEVLREADRLKDEFMAVVSHELRTPLTAISGYSDILLRQLSGPLNDRQDRQVVGIRDAARRLLALINDLLDVSKLEAGTLDLHLAPTDAISAIERAAAATRIIAATKGVRIEVRALASPVPPALADDERLQQILVNLLVNAIKFTPQGGSVWAEAGAEHGMVVFRVEDTGVGLAPGQAARIWDRFYQGESSSTRRFGGAGLGLSIVRRLAELHGGRADAASAGVDRGSTFTVWLPAALPAADGAFPPAVPVDAPRVVGTVQDETPRAAHGTILVVEDDPHIATVLRTYLESDGYRVEVATDGQQALVAARTLLPFAITLDISLPKLDGWSVLNALKREPTTADIPVVIVSIVDNRDFGMVLGATDYLVKPIDHERLQTVLRNLRHLRRDGEGPILVVDDDPALRDVLGSMLIEEGWRVTTASDGALALAAIAQERPSAVVLDLMMPHVDGFEVLQTLRAQPATRDLPVIVVTAKDLTADDRVRLAQSAQRVIVKQAVRIDELRQELRAMLASHHSGSNSV